jgi:hypothetical protein
MKTPKRSFSMLLVVGMLSGILVGQQPATQPQTSIQASVQASVPRLVNFSGRATDIQGKVVSGVAGVTFAIYRDQYEGSPLWMETQSVNTDGKGLYTAQLGATRTEGLPLDLFSSGEARWLAVRINGGEEQPRVLLLSVPYALKAADAETIGGLPPSAFVLASSAKGIAGTTSTVVTMASPSALPPSGAITGTGTVSFVPLWDSTSDIVSSALFQTGSGTTAKVGINTNAPSASLDVAGTANVRGQLTMPSAGIATAAGGKKSQPIELRASSFNSGSAAAVAQNFVWEAEPAANNTAAPSGTLNLLFASGTTAPAETGLKINNKGLITFAAGQTFPGGGGGGGITGVTAGTDLTGGGTTGTVTLNLDTTKVPQLATANNFTGNQTVNGNVSATGIVTGTSFQIGSNPIAFGSFGKANAFLGFAGNTTMTGPGNTATGYQAFLSNTTGLANTADGSDALIFNSTGSYNTATGDQALYLNQTSSFNTATGYQTLRNNAGGYNTATGYQAMFSNQGGQQNTATGTYALYANVSGINNTATGQQALSFNINGNYNTAEGMFAMFLNTAGSNNTAVGYQALYSNTADLNTAVGQSALFKNTSGTANTAVGDDALIGNVTGSSNTSLGTSSLALNTAANNTAVGAYSMLNNVTGTYLSCLGISCNVSQDGLTNSSAIGAYATVGQSNTIVLGGTKGNAVTVGIGTATPFNDYGLDVDTTNSNGTINGGVVVNASGGNLYLGMTNGTHKFRVDTNGVAYANGGFQSSGADFAESVAVRGARSGYEAGDLLQIARGAHRSLVLAHSPYSTLVAGIYSTKPGLLATPHSIDEKLDAEVPLAIVGIVPCKVTAQNGPIQEGDLLVTSSQPGYAMKGTDRRRMLGAVVGKALEPMTAGTGVIQVLVTLQ